MHKNHIGGVVPSPEDKRDYRRVVDGVAAFPYEFEVPLSIDNENQGSVGACVAFAVAGILEQFTGQPRSEGFIYGYRPEGYYQDIGMRPREACKTVAKYGGVKKTTMPLLLEVPGMTKFVENNRDVWEPEGKEYTIAQYIRLYSPAELKSWLMTYNLPVLLTHDYFDSLHAEICYGWKGSDVKLHNSWGSDYSQHMVPSSAIDEIWGILPMEKNYFVDVDKSVWYSDAIEWVSKHGIMGGFPDGSFKPNDSLTRAQMAVMLYRQSEQKLIGGAQRFKDVEPGSWYYEAVNWCSMHSIFNGDDLGNFNPDKPITRAQLAAVINRRFGRGDAINTYKDVRITSWYFEDVVRCKYMNGYDDGLFRPDKEVTRAEAAAVLYRVLS